MLQKKILCKLEIPRNNSLDFYIANLPIQNDRLVWIKICSALKALGAKANDIFRWDNRLINFRSLECLTQQFARFIIPKRNFHEYLQSFFITDRFLWGERPQSSPLGRECGGILEEAFGLSDHYITETVCVQYISTLPVSDKRCTLDKSPTGSGKSYRNGQYIREIKPERCLVLVSSKSLAFNVCIELNKTIILK